jgi:hypothetical protein
VIAAIGALVLNWQIKPAFRRLQYRYLLCSLCFFNLAGLAQLDVLFYLASDVHSPAPSPVPSLLYRIFDNRSRFSRTCNNEFYEKVFQIEISLTLTLSLCFSFFLVGLSMDNILPLGNIFFYP